MASFRSVSTSAPGKAESAEPPKPESKPDETEKPEDADAAEKQGSFFSRLKFFQGTHNWFGTTEGLNVERPNLVRLNVGGGGGGSIAQR